MAEIAHANAEQTTQQTTTSATYGDVTGASIASGSFVAGKKYRIKVTAHVNNSAGSGPTGVKVLHGTTDFADSESIQARTDVNRWWFYSWFHVWTAVSGEGIKVQLKSDGTNTARIDQIFISAINLSDDVTENTDWFFGERSTDDALTSTYLAGATTGAFTPSGASDWLVETASQIDSGADTSVSAQSRIVRSGEASSTLPQMVLEGRASQIAMLSASRVFALTGVSNTFTEESGEQTTGGGHTRLHSKIFALNLNKFKNHAFAYTEADLELGTTAFGDQIQTLSITPDLAGDVEIGAYWGFDANAVNTSAKSRVQVDNADQPPDQTTDTYNFFGNDNRDETPQGLHTVENLTASAHTIDLDASASTVTGAPTAQERSLWAFTMELAAGAASITPTVGAQALSGVAGRMDLGMPTRSALRGT